MKSLKLLVSLAALSAASHAMAWDYVLLDSDKAADNLHLTSQQINLAHLQALAWADQMAD